MTFRIVTLGCKVNQYDSQVLADQLIRAGYKPAEKGEKADVCILNSCTVTAESSRKSRQALRRLKADNEPKVTVITGCYPQAFPDEVSRIEEADVVLGNKTNDILVLSVAAFLSDGSRIVNVIPHKKEDPYCTGNIEAFEGHTRAFIKIQDGCNRYCTYCIIPKSRGFSRSKPLTEIGSEIRALAQRGFKEIVFVGINLSNYGRDLENTDLCDALILAEKTEGIERIRLGSLEPDHITDSIIEKLAQMKKFCPQFHLSLQSGCDRTLKRMNRHYTAEEYALLCRKLRETFPDVSLTTDIITGFPGETDEDFAETVAFAEKIGFMKIHVFPFSPREGTPAFSYGDKVAANIKNERCEFLQSKGESIRSRFLSSYIGKTVNVLFETPKNGIQQGYTENYTPVCVCCEETLTGEIRKVKIGEIKNDVCFGTLI